MLHDMVGLFFLTKNRYEILLEPGVITFTEGLLGVFYSIYFKNKRINYICKIDF